MRLEGQIRLFGQIRFFDDMRWDEMSVIDLERDSERKWEKEKREKERGGGSEGEELREWERNQIFSREWVMYFFTGSVHPVSLFPKKLKPGDFYLHLTRHSVYGTFDLISHFSGFVVVHVVNIWNRIGH